MAIKNIVVILPVLLPILCLAIPIIWLYAEFKLGRWTRITFGILFTICGAFLIYVFCQDRLDHESAWHRNSIRDAEALLKQGQTNVVISAFETYTSIAATDSTFRASQLMMHTLGREVESNTALEPTATAHSVSTNK